MTKKLPEKLRLWEVSKNEWFLWKEKITLEWSSANDIIRTVNQLIDYITPEAPTDTEKKGDWISELYKSLWLKHEIYHTEQSFRSKLETYLPKPVEQELIPLLPRDIVAITDEIITLDELGKVDEDRIHKILSKYWVPKQEDIYSTNPFVWVWWVWAGTKDIDLTTTTPQATSVKRCWQNHCIDPITEEVLCWKECFEATSVIDVEEAVDRIWQYERGEKVLVSNDNNKWEQKIYLTTIEWAYKPYICVCCWNEYYFNNGDKFEIFERKYIKPLEEPIKEMTMQEVETALGHKVKIVK